MEGDRHRPIANQSYTCRSYDNIVPLVNADFDASHIECNPGRYRHFDRR